MRKLILLVAFVLCLPIAAPAPPAFPVDGKAIRIIVPAPGGNVIDHWSREVATRMAAALGLVVYVDNRPGASGLIGAQEAARATPDGHTLFNGSIQTHVFNVLLMPDPIVRAEQALKPVTMLNRGPIIILVNANLPVNSLKDLLNLARSQPRQINYGTGGVAGAGHLFAELLASGQGVEMVPVHYKGSGAELVNVAAGLTQVAFTFYNNALPYIQDGKLRPLAITSARRMPQMAHVPTVGEEGFGELEFYAWTGFFVPQETPDPIVRRLYQELAAVIRSEGVAGVLEGAGAEAGGQPPEQFAEFIRSERERWGKLIRERGIKLE